MDLVSLLILVLIFGVLFWIIQTAIPMPAPFKQVALVILAIIFIVYLLDGVHLGHFRLLVR